MKYTNTSAHSALRTALFLGGLLVAASAAATPNQVHIRGTISNIGDSGFTVNTKQGSQKVALSSKTKIAGVVPSSLDDIEPGTFIGTANVAHDSGNRALEVVVFPESMKGLGLGDYSWDLSPSDMKGHGDNAMGSSSAKKGAVEDSDSMGGGSAMTNGTVESTGDSDSMGSSSAKKGAVGDSDSMGGGSAMTNGTVKSTGDSDSMGSNSAKTGAVEDSDSMGGGSAMTNGTVKSASGSSSMTVKVDYGKGKKTIKIPSDAPVVALQKGSQSDLEQGAHVFVIAKPDTDPAQANLVLVGIDGTVPPM